MMMCTGEVADWQLVFDQHREVRRHHMSLARCSTVTTDRVRSAVGRLLPFVPHNWSTRHHEPVDELWRRRGTFPLLTGHVSRRAQPRHLHRRAWATHRYSITSGTTADLTLRRRPLLP